MPVKKKAERLAKVLLKPKKRKSKKQIKRVDDTNLVPSGKWTTLEEITKLPEDDPVEFVMPQLGDRRGRLLYISPSAAYVEYDSTEQKIFETADGETVTIAIPRERVTISRKSAVQLMIGKSPRRAKKKSRRRKAA